jgi:DNA-binding NarL/FixJ family response regulator
MAEGLSNAAIGGHLTVTEAAVSKHIANILAKLNIPPGGQNNRRVLAVLTYLRG